MSDEKYLKIAPLSTLKHEPDPDPCPHPTTFRSPGLEEPLAHESDLGWRSYTVALFVHF